MRPYGRESVKGDSLKSHAYFTFKLLLKYGRHKVLFLDLYLFFCVSLYLNKSHPPCAVIEEFQKRRGYKSL